jgi:hypothetical protein
VSAATDLPPEQASQPPEQASQRHPTNGIDERVHQRHRLGILTITAEASAPTSATCAKRSA